MTDRLIISYAFSPTNTTTSNVVAKRILSQKKHVDVICGSLNSLNKDFSLEKVLNEYVDNKIVIDSEFGTDWDTIKDFCNKSINILGKYGEIYSRANFVHSHFLALEYKLANPNVYWKAEFSDPLIKTFNNRRLSEAIDDKDYVNRINIYLKDRNLEEISYESDINEICEYLTFIFADEIIFTNENQKKVMLDNFDIDEIVNKKSIISPHPTLDSKYYHITKSNYEIDDNYINFAYFGVIFSNRTFEDFITAFDNVKSDNVKLHIFTSSKTLFEQVLSQELYEKSIINDNVDYLEFLNLTTRFDVLLVEDNYTKDSFSINPYLPSKISDYIGSSTPIWAVCEDGSVMEKIDVEYKSKLNDFKSNVSVLKDILNADDINMDENEYQRHRLNHLTQKITELISVAENEFRKDKEYEAKIKELENSGKIRKFLKKI